MVIMGHENSWEKLSKKNFRKKSTNVSGSQNDASNSSVSRPLPLKNNPQSHVPANQEIVSNTSK